MKTDFFPARYVCSTSHEGFFAAYIGPYPHALGFKILNYGIRVMLIWWHWCVLWK